MSLSVMSLAWYVGGLTPAQKAVLVALADHASDGGGNARPSVGRLTVKTSCAERTVRRALADLREMGLIHIVHESAQHRATEYALDLSEMQARAINEYSRPARNAPLESPDLPESPPDLPENSARPARNAPDPSYNDQNDHYYEEPQEQNPVIQLADHFSELTAIYWNANNPKFEHEWKRPLEALLKKAGSIEQAKETITQAHKLMTAGEKVYRISNPSSIQVTAVNLLNGAATKQNGNGHYGNYWLEVEREIKKNGRRSTRKWDGPTARAIRKCGGYSVLCNKAFPEAEQAFKIAFNDLEIAAS